MIEKIKKIIPKKLFRALQPIYHFCLSFLAAAVYFFPSRKLIVIGVTGTAGKTSTAYLIKKIFEQSGYKTGLTSTTVFSDGNREWLNDKKMTMPGRFFIQKILQQMVKNECRYAVVETSSEGIKQFRHRFINYDTTVFTGLYPEHIESHGSFEKYKEAKGKLFAHLKRYKNKYVNEEKKVCLAKSGLNKLTFERVKKTIIVNGDDEHVDYFLNFWSEAKIIYSFNQALELESFTKNLPSESLVREMFLIKAELRKGDLSGGKFAIGSENFNLKLMGDFNSLNALAAYCVGLNHGLNKNSIKLALEGVASLAGKMELINEGQNFIAMVDYSFEPKALQKLYETIKVIEHRRLIHVLGSTGGGRDKSRRPILGRLAAEQAQIVIITNEDPYDEDPAQIINQVAAGAEMAGKVRDKNLFKILDRRDAIKKALELAEENDLVLLTGKGSEQYICLAKGQKMPWDDREELRRAIVDNMCIDK